MSLEPGESQETTIELDVRSFAAWDVRTHEWVAEPGEFEILVGASSNDIGGKALLTLV